MISRKTKHRGNKLKTKKTPRKKLIEILDKLVKNIAKVRDKFICQKCGEKVSGSNCHGSHVKPVSQGHKLRWDELNVKVLCGTCHLYWWHKNPLEAARWFNEKFPDRAKYLDENTGIKKFYDEELMELKQNLTMRLNELKNEEGV